MTIKHFLFLTILICFQLTNAQSYDKNDVYLYFNDKKDVHIAQPNEVDVFEIAFPDNSTKKFQLKNWNAVHPSKDLSKIRLLSRKKNHAILSDKNNSVNSIYIVRKSDQEKFILYETKWVD